MWNEVRSSSTNLREMAEHLIISIHVVYFHIFEPDIYSQHTLMKSLLPFVTIYSVHIFMQ